MANKLAKISTSGAEVAPSSSYKETKEDKERRRRYDAEDALRCLTRAAEIVKNKTLMDDVRQLVQEQTQNLKKMAKTVGKAA